MKWLLLAGGYRAAIDDEDFDWLNQWSWFVHGGKPMRSPLAHEREANNSTTVYMSREIAIHGGGLDSRSKNVVVHRDGDKLNLQRSNLLVTTQGELQRGRRRPRQQKDPGNEKVQVSIYLPRWAKQALDEEVDKRKMTITEIVLEALQGRMFMIDKNVVAKPIGSVFLVPTPR